MRLRVVWAQTYNPLFRNLNSFMNSMEEADNTIQTHSTPFNQKLKFSLSFRSFHLNCFTYWNNIITVNKGLLFIKYVNAISITLRIDEINLILNNNEKNVIIFLYCIKYWNEIQSLFSWNGNGMRLKGWMEWNYVSVS